MVASMDSMITQRCAGVMHRAHQFGSLASCSGRLRRSRLDSH